MKLPHTWTLNADVRCDSCYDKYTRGKTRGTHTG